MNDPSQNPKPVPKMNIKLNRCLSLSLTAVMLVTTAIQEGAFAQNSQIQNQSELDKQVSAFLNSRSRIWRNANVPYSDGKLLHDIIVENNYKNVVEIGTSTGHSAIWIAWALSKTGGKMVTIEIDQRVYNQALENFKEAGVSQYIDARLADAHDLVPELQGPIDFVFCDADKEWYTNYFKSLDPKIRVGGCFAAHNTNQRGVTDFIRYVNTLPNYDTTIDRTGGGMGISYKTSE